MEENQNIPENRNIPKGDPVEVCGCGKLLYEVLVEGKRIGLNHPSVEDTEHHDEYFCGLRAIILNLN